jgi:hypothetical protein
MNAANTRESSMRLAHSNGKPDVPALMTNINVRFAPILPAVLPVKLAMKIYTQNQPAATAFFQTAARMDACAPDLNVFHNDYP